jgi:hypothetical protein
MALVLTPSSSPLFEKNDLFFLFPGHSALGLRWIRHQTDVIQRIQLHRKKMSSVFWNDNVISHILPFLISESLVSFTQINQLTSTIGCGHYAENLWANLLCKEFGVKSEEIQCKEEKSSSKNLFFLLKSKRKLLYQNAAREAGLKSFSQMLRVPLASVRMIFPQYR